MGDCRIRILIQKACLPATFTTNNVDDEWHAISHVTSADATIRDVYNATLAPIWNQQTLPSNLSLWDCTLHPPKEITDWLTEFGETSGPKSKTLYDAGWFPSGTLQILPRGTEPSTSQANYSDTQYNLPSESTVEASASAPPVRLTGTKDGQTILPSQVLQSVTQRFPEIDEDEERKRAIQVRKQMIKERKAKERKRHASLETRIRQLEESSTSSKKKQAVSQQVRRMLIKSRCTGSSTLKMHDRVYLHIVIVQGDDDAKEDFRYFSRQDTVARIVSAVAKVNLPQQAELLVRRSDGEGETVYRRLPVAMRLYEAIAGGYIQEVDSVVIRCFTPPDEEPTTCITESEIEEEDQPEAEMEVVEEARGKKECSNETKPVADDATDSMKTDDAASNEVFTRMTNAISTMDDTASAKSKKKSSSTSEKVRTMLMKSKATGDKKRIPKMDDRFFLELVTVNDYDGKCSASTSPIFLARTDSVERIMTDCVSVPSGCTATLYALTDEQCAFRVVTGGVSLRDAEASGLIKCFDRIVVRIFKQ